MKLIMNKGFWVCGTGFSRRALRAVGTGQRVLVEDAIVTTSRFDDKDKHFFLNYNTAATLKGGYFIDV
jgi:hypothetical protein